MGSNLLLWVKTGNLSSPEGSRRDSHKNGEVSLFAYTPEQSRYPSMGTVGAAAGHLPRPGSRIKCRAWRWREVQRVGPVIPPSSVAGIALRRLGLGRRRGTVSLHPPDAGGGCFSCPTAGPRVSNILPSPGNAAPCGTEFANLCISFITPAGKFHPSVLCFMPPFVAAIHLFSVPLSSVQAPNNFKLDTTSNSPSPGYLLLLIVTWDSLVINLA